jgi:citrate lyase subunit beta/citryl-CoA lyase
MMRSLLFAPADSDRKLDKAFASGTDAVIIDLEDSVALDSKPLARERAAHFLTGAVRSAQRPQLIVRINSLPSGLADADLEAVVPAAPDAILLPNSGSSARLAGLTWGAEDLSADLGATANRDANGQFLEPYRLARALCLVGAVAAQVEPIDTVYVDFRNEAGLRRETEEACRDGFTGKMAIHPAQVAVINEVFTPTAEAVAQADAIVAAFAAAPGSGVVGINGVMYDTPHLKRAQRVLAQAKAARSRGA